MSATSIVTYNLLLILNNTEICEECRERKDIDEIRTYWISGNDFHICIECDEEPRR